MKVRLTQGWIGTIAVALSLLTSGVAAAAGPAHTPGATPSPVKPLSASSTDVQPFIVGGRDASEPYSFAASLQLPVSGSLKHFCTSSLIHPRWVASAGHCEPERIVPGTTQIRVGSTKRSSGGTLVGVERVVVHPQYDPNKPGFDVVLVRLDRPVNYQPIMIASNAGKVGSLSRVLGWGVTCDKDLVNDPECRKAPETLQELDTVRLPDDKCTSTSFFDPKYEMCIAARNGEKKSACFGDSGGPLVKEVRHGHHRRWVQVGIVTGDGDDAAMRPYVCTTAPNGEQGAGIFQKAPKYREWMARVIWNCNRSEGAQFQALTREADQLMAAA